MDGDEPVERFIFQNPMENREYIVEVPLRSLPPRASEDMVFMQRLMNEAQRLQEQGLQGPYRIHLEEGQLDAPALPTSNVTTDDTGCDVASAFKWPHEAILLLLETFRVREERMVSGKVSQKRTWESVAKELVIKGYEVTGPQCMSKFNGMKRTYKSIKDHNNKSGNNPRSWPYLDVMDSLLEKRPFMEPPVVNSSSGFLSKAGASSQPGSSAGSTASTSQSYSSRGFSESSVEDEFPSTPSTVGGKRKRTADLSIAQAILQSREIAEANKMKRHLENSAFKEKIAEKLDRLLEKL